MPQDFGVPDLVVNEYQRFVDNARNLTGNSTEQSRRYIIRQKKKDPTTQYVHVPGWSDVIKLTPKERPTQQEVRAYLLSVPKGKPSPLSPERSEVVRAYLQDALERRDSATPEYAKAWAQLMTAIDNVQDLISTVGVFGRLAINGALRLMPLGGAIAPRVVPFLGWILLAGDLLNLVNLLGILAFPLFAWWCGGPKAVLAGGLPQLVMKRGLKQKLTSWNANNPWGRAGRLARDRAARRILPEAMKLLEVAQTLDNLYGVGLSYGAIWGLVSDAAYAVVGAGEGKRTIISTPTGREELLRRARPLTENTSREQARDRRAAAVVLATAPTIARVQEEFTAEFHLRHMLAVSAALSILRPVIEHPAMADCVELAAAVEWSPPTWSPERLAESTVGALAPELPPAVWALRGSPDRIPGRALLEDTPREIAAALRQLVEPRRNSAEGCALGAVASRIIDRASILLTGRDDAVRFTLTPPHAVAESLAEAGLFLVPSNGEARTAAFFDAAAEEMDRRNRHGLSQGELLGLIKAHDLTYIFGRPADYPVPAIMREFERPTEGAHLFGNLEPPRD